MHISLQNACKINRSGQSGDYSPLCRLGQETCLGIAARAGAGWGKYTAGEKIG
jgi:hypothetical protein